MRHTPHRTLLRRRLLALLAASAVLVAACGNSGDDDDTAAGDTTTTAAPDDGGEGEGEGAGTDGGDVGEFQPIEGVNGVTDDQIQYAVLGTGPANPLGYCLLECYAAGVKARFDYQNSIGGVHGRDIVVSRTEDDELGNTQVKLLELVEAPDVFGILGAPLIYAGYSDVGNTDVPLYTTFPASPEADGFDNIYVAGGTLCLDCPSPPAVQGAVLAGATKAASLGFGVSQASKDCVASTKENFELYGPGVGIEFAYENDELAYGFPNGVGPEVTAMKEAGVDYISTCIDQTSVVTLKQEMARQGMEAVVALPQGYGDQEYLQANADLLEGDILSVRYRPFEADAGDSMLETMQEWLEQTGVQMNDYAIQGWIGGDMAIAALLAAGPQFDQASVIEAFNQVTDYTAGGLLAPPVDWTTAHDAGAPDDARRTCAAYLIVKGGALELQGDPAEPFFCWDTPLDEWAEPETAG
ncbi:MAG TPA: ABC transporter substrate-binding protein [Acidimicrobiales bacterium]|nr:ABC transporter substrate-binding protein [Acidimicrobiales bacterium]